MLKVREVKQLKAGADVMEDVNTLLYEGLVRYYTVLRNTGYITQQDVYRLLLLAFIAQFIEECENFITQEDCNVIAGIIACISDNSCLIPYTCHIAVLEPLLNYIKGSRFRYTEDGDIRMAEDEYFRVVEG